MNIWPRDPRKTSWHMVLFILFSGSVSFAYILDQAPLYRGLPIDIWPWLTTGLFLLIFILGLLGLAVMKHEFTGIAERMAKSEEEQARRMESFENSIKDIWKQVNYDTNRLTGIKVMCDARHGPGVGDE